MIIKALVKLHRITHRTTMWPYNHIFFLFTIERWIETSSKILHIILSCMYYYLQNYA